MINSKDKLFSIILLFILMAILCPSPAVADIPGSLKTYTVYNDFNATVNAFQRLGLMMSDASYRGLFFSVIAIGLVIGGIATVGRGILFGKSNAMAWISLFGMLFAGVMTYSAFVRNTTSITVYDEALNQQIAIGGIPDGVAFIAGLANKIETGLVDIIWTSGDPRSYRENAGGIGFGILTKAFEGGVDLSGTGNGGIHNNVSLRRYIKDCLYFELLRPGTPLDLNDININTDFIPLLQEASNPAIYTVWYDDTYKAGKTVTCTEAWSKLNAYFNTLTNGSTPVKQFWQNRCRKVLPETTGAIGPSLTQTCEDKATGLINSMLGVAVSESQLMRQYLVASELWNVMRDTDPDMQMSTLAGQATGTHLIGMGIQANDWIPIMRSTLFSIMLGVMPFLFLLIPTPLFSRAVSLIFGVFIFLALWGVCDALAHSFAMDKAYSIFDEIKISKVGFLSMMLMKNTSCKALAAFGAARWSAMMIAGMMSSMLVKVGGSALVHAISGFNMKGYGAMAGASVATPQGRGSELSALRRSVPTEAYSNLYKFDATAAADTYKEFTDINTNLGAVDTIGGGNASVASGRVADANVMGMRERIAHTSAIKAAADRTFGGDVDKMLNAEQDILRGKAAGGAAQIIGDGRKPLAVGVQAGQAEGIGLEASGDRVTVVGDDGAYSTELSKKLNEDAKMGVRRALDDIAQTGRITPETGAVLANIAGHPLGRAQLASQGIGDRIIKPGEEAENFANYLSGYGISVRPEDLAGATARMNMWTDTDGNLHPSLVATNKGVRVAEHNTGTKESDLNTEQAGRITGKEGATAGHYAIHFDPGTGEIVGIKGEGGFTASTGSVILSHDADGADRIQVIDPKTGKAVWTSAKLGEESIAKHDVKEEFGWSGQFGGHHFTSARRTDLGGGKVSIDGVTDEGKRITLVGSSRGDNEQVISMTQEQGPNYKGALAMAMRGNIPKEAMHDPLHRAVYANQFASEVSKFYQGTMDRKEINRLTKSWSAQGGVDIKIPGIASGGASFKGSDENVSQIESKSARDVMTQVTNIVLGSDSSDAQKQSAMQALADTVIHMNAEQAEGLEKAGTMVHREQHPTGVIRRDAPDSGFEEIKRPKMELP